MNRWRSSEIWCVLSLAIVFVVSAGCYSSSGRSRGGSDPDSEKPSPQVKKIGLAVIDAIAMNGEALRSPECSVVPVSLAEIRENEAVLRLKLVTEALERIADYTSVRQIGVGREDCRFLSAIEAAAWDESRGAYDQLSEEIKAKPAVHIRVVVWNGDQSSRTPSYMVVQSDWGLMRSLESAGFRRRASFNHFAVLRAAASGYVGQWSRFSEVDKSFRAETVEDIGPDPASLNNIKGASERSAARFVEWLGRKVSGL